MRPVQYLYATYRVLSPFKICLNQYSEKSATPCDLCLTPPPQIEGKTNAAAIAEARKEQADLSKLKGAHKKDAKEIASSTRSAAQRQARLVPQADNAAAQVKSKKYLYIFVTRWQVAVSTCDFALTPRVQTDDPIRRKNIVSALNSIEKLLPRVVAASQAAVESPNDDAKQRQVDRAASDLQVPYAPHSVS